MAKITRKGHITIVPGISKDLPYAHRRFCSTEGITNVITLSGFRDTAFGRAYGVDIINGPMEGLYARSIVIVDEYGKVIYTQLVPEIDEEPDYDGALAELCSEVEKVERLKG